MRAFKTVLGVLVDGAIGACLFLVVAALGLFGLILGGIIYWLVPKSRSWTVPTVVSDHLEGPGEIRLSQVCKHKCPKKEVVAVADIEFLYRVLKCPSCQFNDEAARSQGNPWCGAPEPPDIDSFKCQTFQARA